MAERPGLRTETERLVNNAITATAAFDHLTDDQAWEITDAVVAALLNGAEEDGYRLTGGRTTWEVSRADTGDVLGWAVPNLRDVEHETYLAVPACTQEQFDAGQEWSQEMPTRELAERYVAMVPFNLLYCGRFEQVRDYIIETSRRNHRG